MFCDLHTLFWFWKNSVFPEQFHLLTAISISDVFSLMQFFGIKYFDAKNIYGDEKVFVLSVFLI